MITYDVAPYSSELDESIALLFEKEGFHRTPEFLRWMFSPPNGVGLVAVGRDSVSDNRIAGVLGMLPTPVVTARQVRKSYLIFDVMVDAAFRGRGVFSGLAKAAMSAAAESGAAFVWGFPNNQAAHGWFQRFGWTRLGSPPLMVRPLRSGLVTRRLGPAFGWMDLPLARAQKLRLDVRPIGRFGEDADRLWAHSLKGDYCAVERGSSWLNWRTVEAPGKDYRRIGAYVEGELAAFVITSREERRGLKLVYVMEALSRTTDQQLLARLIRNELAAAAADGCALALCLSPAAGPNRKAFRAAGFWPLPSRFHPSETHVGIGPLQ
jgi:GNAT superfamily N-acetyltransferase